MYTIDARWDRTIGVESYSFEDSHEEKLPKPAPNSWCTFPSDAFKSIIVAKYGDYQNFALIVKRSVSTVKRWIYQGRFPAWARPYILSDFSRVFDRHSPQWNEDPHCNNLFLANIRHYCNDVLRHNGYVFVNDIYKNLGLHPSVKGQLYGWRYHADQEHEPYVDFDWVIFKDVVIIDFLPDGIILDEVYVRDESFSPMANGDWTTNVLCY